ncbi:DNA primase [Bradyrhizobium sp. 83012]|uniref:DNA primase n=1 Tax=Bradyrhizobium aeschynomenes TaxID=2734909 RepID=A0ABX2CQ26_9BRAD|nr:CHC2 zinc finger domain-containing protein [Bradyrhizobium aeschynomenes]NPU69990.1 DNA primase [Bradyrhizobium aeschynomenes]
MSDAEIDDIKARNPLAEVAGRYVRLRKAGRRLVGPCPVCGGGKASQRFEIKDDDGWVCAVCGTGGDVIRLVQLVEGCDFRSAVERLGGAGTIDAERARQLEAEREAKRARREAEAAKYREAERRRLWKIWDGAGDIAGSVAARYLAGRGLALPEKCPGLRFLEAAAYFHGDEIDDVGRKSARVLSRGPAMLAAFIRPDGHFGGLHMTWLVDGDPPVKLEIADPETGELLPAKKMRGSKTGAFIKVAPAAEVPRRLFLGEGIETVLSVYTALAREGRELADTAFWAAGDLGNLAGKALDTVAHPSAKRPDGKPQRVPGPWPDPDDKGLSIPDEVTELILLGDGDSEPVLTRHAMIRAARRYAREGRTVRIAFAPAGMDFNDLLQGGAG